MDETLIKERIKNLQALFKKAPIGKAFGMSLCYNDKNQAVFDLPHNPSICSPVGIHGGVIATLLDMSGWFTAAVYYDNWIATIDLNIKLLKHVKEANLHSTGELVRAGNRIAVTKMEVNTDTNELIAIGSATFSLTSVSYRKSK